MIVDPVTQAVVGQGFSQSDTHHLKHAVMVAIDDVAYTQGAGAWKNRRKCRNDGR